MSTIDYYIAGAGLLVKSASVPAFLAGGPSAVMGKRDAERGENRAGAHAALGLAGGAGLGGAAGYGVGKGVDSLLRTYKNKPLDPRTRLLVTAASAAGGGLLGARHGVQSYGIGRSLADTEGEKTSSKKALVDRARDAGSRYLELMRGGRVGDLKKARDLGSDAFREVADKAARAERLRVAGAYAGTGVTAAGGLGLAGALGVGPLKGKKRDRGEGYASDGELLKAASAIVPLAGTERGRVFGARPWTAQPIRW